MAASANSVAARPVVFWASEPVHPGDVTLLYGGDLPDVLRALACVRRRFLRGWLQGVAALGAAYSLEERILLAAIDENTPAARPKPSLDPASMPCGTIGKFRISRLFLGGNLRQDVSQ